MEDPMFYRILVNGKELGVVGHRDIENIHLSASGDTTGIEIFVNAVCNENGEQYYYSWIEEKISPDDSVEILPVESSQVTRPLKKMQMGHRFKREVDEKIICDFCYRDETEAGEMIHLDEHRPTICSECVQVCAKIYEQWAEKV
jgi:hypothetical protein